MSRLPELEPAQTQLPYYPDVIVAGEHDGVDPNRRITLRRLIGVISEEVKSDYEPTLNDIRRADPGFLEQHLYVTPGQKEYRDTELPIVILGNNGLVPATSSRVGVLFPLDEFPTVARNARDLAKHTYNKTRRARKSASDREDTHDAARRSVIHAMEAKIDSMEGLMRKYDDENSVFRSLYKDLKTNWIAHQKANVLDRRRQFADEKIHETAELVCIRFNLGNIAVKGLHDAIKRNLYAGNKSSSERAHTWHQYIKVPGRHNNAKSGKVEVSIKQSENVLTTYRHNVEEE